MSKIGIIGGSGAYLLLARKDLSGVRFDPITTPYGLSQPIFKIGSGEEAFYFLSRHGEEGYNITATEVNYRANIHALNEMGVEKIISWSGPGAINKGYSPGDYVVPHDVIDETRRREGTFFRGKGIGFIRQSPTFCPVIRSVLMRVLGELSLNFWDEGVYVCTEGPRLETAAEVNKFRILGGDLVGMTLVPEVFLAKEMEMCYASLCYVTNYAEGIREREFQAGILFEGLLDEDEAARVNRAIERFPEIILNSVRLIRESVFGCKCSKILERYRKNGLI